MESPGTNAQVDIELRAQLCQGPLCLGLISHTQSCLFFQKSVCDLSTDYPSKALLMDTHQKTKEASREMLI